MTRMKPAEFAAFLERDGYRCIHCGHGQALTPQHRQNRGMGGSKAREVPSNVVVLCSEYNGRIESDPAAATEAKRYGWKLESWEDPKQVPVYDPQMFSWFLLDDDYGRTFTAPPDPTARP